MIYIRKDNLNCFIECFLLIYKNSRRVRKTKGIIYFSKIYKYHFVRILILITYKRKAKVVYLPSSYEADDIK